MDAYLASPVLPGASPSFAFEPIFVHPGHGLDAPSWPKASTDDEDDDQLPTMSELDISDPSFSPARRGSDLADVSETDATWFTESSYFGGYKWPSSSSISTMDTGFFEHGSPSSSRSSTPTPESPVEDTKAKAFDASLSPPPPLAPSSFFFNSASPHLRSSSRSLPSSPPPSHGGASMQRSFSLPVEAETVLQSRLSRRSSLHTAAIVMSPSLSRSSSSSGSGSMPPPAAVRRPTLSGRRESAPPPTEGLGFSLPQSSVHLAFEEKATLSTYPYNVASPKRSRMSRSYSTPDVPSFHIPMSPIKSTASGSTSPSIRSRRPTLDFKMTPITPTTPTFASLCT